MAPRNLRKKKADSDSDEDSDEDVTAFGANNAAVTRDGKMTIAQRNRQARAREQC